ncbi:spermidine/putrescine transport system permease PotB [Rodentibacter pneumotropicus]|uniref:Spermidine/putrescine transport system permease PotB n=1 Tax=Rodentibacter pneumotropicus TaxID=758 RepID=A0A3S4Y170_9PAST|nr:spermidine/putrescine transport system permease PotB [Rodentibacter pneumotropicus]
MEFFVYVGDCNDYLLTDWLSVRLYGQQNSPKISTALIVSCGVTILDKFTDSHLWNEIFLGVKGVLNTMLMDMGILSEPIRILNTEIAVVIGLVYLLLPFMILPLYSAIEN